jgi:CTP synthase
MIFSGRHPQQPIMQILELPTRMHPYFIGAQFHPELTSRPLEPQPMFMGLVAAAIQHANPQVDPAEISGRWMPPALPSTPVEA